MNTFFKTFFICLILCCAFLTYKYLGNDSYSTDLDVSKNNPIFGLEEKIPFQTPKDEEVQNTKTPQKTIEEIKKKPLKYVHTIYFYGVNGKLTPVERELSSKPTLENTISLLLKGPMIPETKKGLYSEIPANVDLISVKYSGNDLIVDLTSNFGNGGGSQSVLNRIEQLKTTIKNYSPGYKIYLYINGQEVEYLGGDGVYIKQPL